MLKRIIAFAGLAAILATAPVFASVTANSVITAQTPTNGKQNFVQGTDSPGTFKTVYTAGTNGSRCNGLTVANNDPSATHVVTIEVANGANSYPLGTFVTAEPTAGQYSTVGALGSVIFGLPVDVNGNPYIQLVSGDTLKVTYASALTSADQIVVYASCSDF